MQFLGDGWETCGAVTVALGTTTIGTFPSGSTSLSGTFTAPSTAGSYTVTATGTSTSPSCLVTTGFEVVALPTLSVSPTTATPGETIRFSGTMPACGPTSVFLGTSLVGTFPSGSFAAPFTLGTHTLTAQGDLTTERIFGGDVAPCTAAANFDVVATPTHTGASGESEIGPGEPETAAPESESGPRAPEATTAPVSATPHHVTG
jgi:hypothetical protein